MTSRGGGRYPVRKRPSGAGGGGTPVIPPNSITNVELADMQGNSVKGRFNPAFGDPENLIIGDKSILGRPAGGILKSLTFVEAQDVLNFMYQNHERFRVGTVLNPFTGAGDALSAPVLDGMTDTWFSSFIKQSTVDVFFSGTFENNEKKKHAACGIFINGS